LIVRTSKNTAGAKPKALALLAWLAVISTASFTNSRLKREEDVAEKEADIPPLGPVL
jgi:hypothetical protein